MNMGIWPISAWRVKIKFLAGRCEATIKTLAEELGLEYRIASLDDTETYTLTSLTATESFKRVLNNEIVSGAHTPSTTFGADFVLTIEGVSSKPLDWLPGYCRAPFSLRTTRCYA
jgi:hypothetical protein